MKTTLLLAGNKVTVRLNLFHIPTSHVQTIRTINTNICMYEILYIYMKDGQIRSVLITNYTTTCTINIYKENQANIDTMLQLINITTT